jgi:hypothetical protein
MRGTLMKPLYPDEYWKVDVTWSKPSAYKKIRDEGHELDEFAYLYLITAKYSSNSPKSIYIGKTYQQCVSDRLNQKDHRARYAAFVKTYPRHSFHISFGEVEISHGNITAKRIDDIERILIYSNEPEHAHNVQNFYEHGVKGSYAITNKGYRATLPKHIMLGVFAK